MWETRTSDSFKRPKEDKEQDRDGDTAVREVEEGRRWQEVAAEVWLEVRQPPVLSGPLLHEVTGGKRYSEGRSTSTVTVKAEALQLQ